MNGAPEQTPPTGWQFKPDPGSVPGTPAPLPNPSSTVPVPPMDQQPVVPPQASPVLQPGPAQAPQGVPAQAAETPVPQTPVPAPIAPAAAPQDANTPPQQAQPERPAQPAPGPEPTLQTDAGFMADSGSHSDRTPGGPMEWTASGSLTTKPAGWFAMIAVAAVVVAGLVFLLIRDVVSSVGVAMAILLFGYYTTRTPRGVYYRLSGAHIAIGNKRYELDQFRSFAVDHEQDTSIIVLMPMKRFMPPLTINYPDEIEAGVVAAFSDRLPMEAYRHDMLDVIIRKLRF